MRKPLFFVAYANAPPGDSRYLRNLPEEQRRIRTTLDAAKALGLCDYVERSNATLSDILDVFQAKRDRVAVFHYAGHARSFELLLETPAGGTAVIDGRALAGFLGQQRGLELVFLNGCATAPQVEALLGANVSLVIATAQNVQDAVAMEFADRFYRGLLSGAGIGKAYREAEAALRASSSADLWRDLVASASASAAWPWSIYVRPGAEHARDWNLPEAARNPLFGIPALVPGDLPPTPFRHLQWFGAEHSEIFFGRGSSIATLYHCATESDGAPVILFYGQAGIGKSSVLAAGLMPRLGKVAEVIYARRDRDRGLTATLASAVGATEHPLLDTWHERELAAGRPLVLVIDQVEEAYTRTDGSGEREVARFLDAVAPLFARPREQRPLGKLILSFRKEWEPEIDHQLVDRKLFVRKVFLARLDPDGVLEAVTGIVSNERLSRHYRLAFEAGVAEMIVDDLVADSESPLAPTLQILLTKMWDASTVAADGIRYFDKALYQRLRKAGLLLGDFLDQQVAALGVKHRDAVESGLVYDVLAYHTTPLGAAEQRGIVERDREYRHCKKMIQEVVEELTRLYVLADPAPGGPSRATRLAHDTIAPLVRSRFDRSIHPGQRARRILENRREEWSGGRRGGLLDDNDLQGVELGAAGMRARTTDEDRLVEASHRAAGRRRTLRRVLSSVMAAAALGIMVASGIAWWQRKEAIAAQKRAVDAQKKEEAERQKSERNLGIARDEMVNSLIEAGQLSVNVHPASAT